MDYSIYSVDTEAIGDLLKKTRKLGEKPTKRKKERGARQKERGAFLWELKGRHDRKAGTK
jgi:hypothetical protein